MQIKAQITKLSQRRLRFRMERVGRSVCNERDDALQRLKKKTVTYANKLIEKDQNQPARETEPGVIMSLLIWIGGRKAGSGYIDRKQEEGLQRNLDRDLKWLFGGGTPEATGKVNGDTVQITLPPSSELNNPVRIQKMTHRFMVREWQKEKKKIARAMKRANR